VSEFTAESAGAALRPAARHESTGSLDETMVAQAAETHPRPASALVESELLVEDVSIDGMCGVY
jgi:mycofactocin precursor